MTDQRDYPDFCQQGNPQPSPQPGGFGGEKLFGKPAETWQRLGDLARKIAERQE